MILYVIDSIKLLVDEVLVITDKEENMKEFSKIFDSSIKLFLDEYAVKSPVVGALTGFKHARGKYSILLACDTPLVSNKIISYLLTLSKGYDAVVPKWPNGYLEPLQAIYNTEKAYTASHKAITQNKFKMYDFIHDLQNLLYVSTNSLLQFDPKLYTFYNINTQSELKRIERIIALA